MTQETDKIEELLSSLGTNRDNIKVAMKIDSRRDDVWQSVEHQTFRRPFSIGNLRVMLRVAAVFAPLIVVAILWKYSVDSSDRLSYYTTTERDTVQLIDGTTVILNANTSITYHQTAASRNVEVEGMAFFDVARNDKQPFVISAGEGQVTVLGTKFTVENISHRERIRVAVEEGKVRFDVDDNSVQLMTNDIATWTSDGRISVERRSCDDDSSWLSGHLRFKDASLEDVLNQLLVHYCEIKGIKDISSPDTIRVTTVFNTQPLTSVLEELTIHFGKKIELSNGYLIISN